MIPLSISTRRRTCTSCFLVALLAVAFATPQSQAQVYSASIEELATTSTAVVVGTTTDIRSFWNEDRTLILTEVTVKVDEQVAGEAASETIITIPGGRVGDALYEVSDMPVFLEGEEVVVFLWQDETGRNLVTGGAQGRIGIGVDDRTLKRVVKTALPTASAASPGAANRSVDGPQEKVPVDQLIKRIKDARER